VLVERREAVVGKRRESLKDSLGDALDVGGVCAELREQRVDQWHIPRVGAHQRGVDRTD
jgi:hypothetical protein